MIRWVALAAGIALVVLAVAAFPRIADTREGLIAEVTTLLAGGAGLLLLTYAFAARKRASQPAPRAAAPHGLPREARPRDLPLGIAGIGLSIVLFTGLAISGGPLWATFGFLLLLPMLAGSVYLCWRSLRANS